MTEHTTQQTTRPVLVTGATGMTGSRVLARLRERGVAVRAASRSSEWGFDWSDPSTWDRVLRGAGAVYLVQNDLDPRAPEFVERAVALGVERVVQLSARGVDGPNYFEYLNDTPAHLVGERAVRASGLEWTILRPGWFSQNFSEGLLSDGVRSGVLRLPTADGATTWIDTEDIAAVAVAALTESGHHGRTYELGGPRALNLSEVAAEISQALGRTIRYEPVSEKEYASGLLAQGWSEAGTDDMVMALSAIRRGLESTYVPGVREALGRDPRGFSDYVARTFHEGWGLS
ncbi:NAD(P)H-binding protein [Nocardiopsis sp. B62]|uniref:NAD(P)H-binding protein n=1 Tax=Nocardiopsis sp. B62 TaxID=2824874 RepID=UPI001B380B04|nr:NAD(P)H-binding protein [Nocardiopsis sp. B62]MBQ1079728.1 NAD(P)H-binding protein [Nocardiopsis sp. B62]